MIDPGALRRAAPTGPRWPPRSGECGSGWRASCGKESTRGKNPKTGRGGLVDVEFAAQFLQLAHGHDVPADPDHLHAGGAAAAARGRAAARRRPTRRWRRATSSCAGSSCGCASSTTTASTTCPRAVAPSPSWRAGSATSARTPARGSWPSTPGSPTRCARPSSKPSRREPGPGSPAFPSRPGAVMDGGPREAPSHGNPIRPEAPLSAPDQPLPSGGRALVRAAAHRPHVPHGLRGGAMGRSAHRSLRPALAGPRRGGPPLRPGDLRGRQGLPPRRRRGPRLPHRQERRPPQPLGGRRAHPARPRGRPGPGHPLAARRGPRSGPRTRMAPPSTSAPSSSGPRIHLE